MNESNLTPRQKYILNLINQSEGLTREQIQQELEKAYSVSKPTLVRDINVLLKEKSIATKGAARNIVYTPLEHNPLLRAFDLERYFADDPDKRINAKKDFDFTIFSHLKSLFAKEEQLKLKNIAHSFSKETKTLSPDILKRELERFVIELSWKSSKIEGNTYTLLETEALIKDSKEAEGKSKSEAVMILNHKNAFEEILKNKAAFKKINLSLINQLHNILVRNLGISTGIRRQPVGITGSIYHPLDNEFQIREAMEKFIVALNTVPNPFARALIVHAMLPYIQPFTDGNKRTGRMLTNAVLLAYDLFPISYRSVSEDEFKKALILFYEQGSIFHVKRIFIEQIKFANETYFR